MKSNTTVIVKKKDSIVFQLSALNLLMLVSFLVVMFMVMSAMKTSTTSSINMFDSMMDLTTHEAKLKSDVMNLYDQTTGYISASAPKHRPHFYHRLKSPKKTSPMILKY